MGTFLSLGWLSAVVRHGGYPARQADAFVCDVTDHVCQDDDNAEARSLHTHYLQALTPSFHVPDPLRLDATAGAVLVVRSYYAAWRCHNDAAVRFLLQSWSACDGAAV